MSVVESIDCIVNDKVEGALADEISVMPGSIMRKLIEHWLSLDDSRSEHALIQKLKNIAAAKDKLRGYTGVTKADAQELLSTLFGTWYEDGRPLTFNGLDGLELVTKLTNELYKSMGKQKPLLVKIEGESLLRFYRTVPKKHSVLFINNTVGSVVKSSSRRETTMFFHKLHEGYLNFDSKGVTCWVVDISDLRHDDYKAYDRFFNAYDLFANFKSLAEFEPFSKETTSSILTKDDGSHAEHKKRVTHAFKNNMAVIIRGNLLAETKDQEKSVSLKSSQLVAKHHLSPDKIAMLPPDALWAGEPEYQAFMQPDGAEKSSNTASVVFVEPSEDGVSLNAEFLCVGYPVKRGQRGRPSTLQVRDNDGLTIVKMPTLETHIPSTTIMYLAVMHHLKREAFDDERSESVAISGEEAINVLNQLGFNVMTVHEFISALTQ